MHALKLDAWYLMYVCKACQTRQVLFPDLSDGKAKIIASYTVTCPVCNHRDHYESENIERYHHLRAAFVSRFDR